MTSRKTPRTAAIHDYEARLRTADERRLYHAAELEKATRAWGDLYENRQAHIDRLTTWHESLREAMG